MTNRRTFLGNMGATALIGVGALTACNNTQNQTAKSDNKGSTDNHIPSHPFADISHDFYGRHQAGITTPVQHHVYFLVADLYSTDLGEIRQMFKDWTQYSAQLTQGNNIKPYDKNPHLPPTDTGEADSLEAYGLTLTFGVSPTFLDKLGLADKAPPEFSHLPKFARDQIRSELSGGDICIQACSHDPQVAFHAVRQLVRKARSLITMKWSQSGYNSFDNGTDTPRNLFGFKDGTANKTTLQNTDKWLWADGAGKTAWFNDGTYLVVRLIQMYLETWDRTSLVGQEDTFGRHRDTGASIGKLEEFEEFDINEKDDEGHLVIAHPTHMGLAKRTGLQLLRRSFSYSSGIDAKTGQFNAGLLFISFQKSPMQFSVIQNAFGNTDKMTEYTTHIGSGLFACFGGVKEGEYLGQKLFED
ncbi:iron uptake transporter deferrochelatase/peroxidase subunit [Moraxella nonliquefaciens]|uniref:Deferrochelatase n=1 Tax=Moraxella nonliquefaciens TaxID=478 RepID=A0A1B8PJI2_MORNO|nr:iron uptake transporter deferrochelatase/peroxidase subunit [Moraxella nonliquefaciens]OBX50861.1 peroxidase [Moraxella nonliquefaciens]